MLRVGIVGVCGAGQAHYSHFSCVPGCRVVKVFDHRPALVLGKAFEGLRLLAQRPEAEYGARFYPVRLYEYPLACVDAVKDFVHAIRDGRPPPCTVDDAARTALACLAGVESGRINRHGPVTRLGELA